MGEDSSPGILGIVVGVDFRGFFGGVCGSRVEFPAGISEENFRLKIGFLAGKNVPNSGKFLKNPAGYRGRKSDFWEAKFAKFWENSSKLSGILRQKIGFLVAQNVQNSGTIQ